VISRIASDRAPLPAAVVERLTDLLAKAIINDMRARLDQQEPAPAPAQVAR
jgi:hypothetical protein